MFQKQLFGVSQSFRFPIVTLSGHNNRGVRHLRMERGGFGVVLGWATARFTPRIIFQLRDRQTDEPVVERTIHIIFFVLYFSYPRSRVPFFCIRLYYVKCVQTMWFMLTDLSKKHLMREKREHEELISRVSKNIQLCFTRLYNIVFGSHRNITHSR